MSAAEGASAQHLPQGGPSRTSRKAVVVGAGPVGCLAALALAKAGWRVHVYDGRPGASTARL